MKRRLRYVDLKVVKTLPFLIMWHGQTYTVEYNRDGSTLRGHIVGRLASNGHRFVANHADDATLEQLSSHEIEPIGRRGKVKTGDDGRNLFAFVAETAKL